MNEQRVEIDGKDYTITVSDDEVQEVRETESWHDTEAGELRASLRKFGDTTTGNFHVHVYKTALQDVLEEIGEAMKGSDLRVVRIAESRLGEDCTYIEWEQPSAMGLYNTPEEPDPKTPAGAMPDIR
jgi:hypothetical protein